MPTTNLISIVGAGHSGSTLLDLVLGSHTDIFSLGEIAHWDRYLTENKDCSCGTPTRSCEFWKEIVAQWESHQLNSPTPSNSLTRTSSNSFGGVAQIGYKASQLVTTVLPAYKFPNTMNTLSPESKLRCGNIVDLYTAIRSAAGKPILCDSSKSVSRFRMLHTRHPKSTKAIYLTRDGRAVTASHYRRFGKDPAQTARRWRFTNLYTQSMLRTLPKDSHIHIRYEEFCRAPEQTLQKICDFVDLPFEASMLKLDGSTRHNIGGNRMRMKGLFDIKEDLKWRNILSNKQISAFDKAAGKTNSKLLGTYQNI